jgi:hypothetical protein
MKSDVAVKSANTNILAISYFLHRKTCCTCDQLFTKTIAVRVSDLSYISRNILLMASVGQHLCPEEFHELIPFPQLLDSGIEL